MLYKTNNFQKKIALLKLESPRELQVLIFLYYAMRFYQTRKYMPNEEKIMIIKFIDECVNVFLKTLPLKNRQTLIECALYLGKSEELKQDRLSVLKNFGFFDLAEGIQNYYDFLLKKDY
jgi:hypothetical protein